VKTSNLEKIIQAGLVEFKTKGYFKTNSNTIAKRAGLAAGTFYNYFKSKDDLFLELYKKWHEDQRSQIFQMVMESPGEKEFSEKLVDIITPFYVDQSFLRNTVQVLKNDSKKIQDFRLEQQKIIIDTILKICKLRNIKRSREEAILFQIQIERYFDAYGSGEFLKLGLKKKKSKEILYNFVHQFTTGNDYI
jgi:AcrR family transcriptional regulator